MIPHRYLSANATTDLDPPPWSLSSASSPRCATPGCGELRGHGIVGPKFHGPLREGETLGVYGYFCADHAAMLGTMREELLESMSQRGRFQQRRDQRKASMLLGSTCCVPDCIEPRDRNEAMCETHLIEEAA